MEGGRSRENHLLGALSHTKNSIKNQKFPKNTYHAYEIYEKKKRQARSQPSHQRREILVYAMITAVYILPPPSRCCSPRCWSQGYPAQGHSPPDEQQPRRCDSWPYDTRPLEGGCVSGTWYEINVKKCALRVVLRNNKCLKF